MESYCCMSKNKTGMKKKRKILMKKLSSHCIVRKKIKVWNISRSTRWCENNEVVIKFFTYEKKNFIIEFSMTADRRWRWCDGETQKINKQFLRRIFFFFCFRILQICYVLIIISFLFPIHSLTLSMCVFLSRWSMMKINSICIQHRTHEGDNMRGMEEKKKEGEEKREREAKFKYHIRSIF